MAPAEIGRRIRDEVVKQRWRWRWVHGAAIDPLALPPDTLGFTSPLPALDTERLPAGARDRIKRVADAILDGRWQVFDQSRDDMVPVPDWFADPKTGLRAPDDVYAFDIKHRNESEVGNIKHIWELSRHHHLTVLAGAYYISGNERYAETVAQHLQSWWEKNPFLSGVHWISGIELGVRLIAWVWSRRLLDGWSSAPKLFEENAAFLQQLYHHQEFLATFSSHGSSANNHLIAEAAGQFVSCCAFPLFHESHDWLSRASSILQREISQQTFPDGFNCELATDYHCFVLELCLAAALEGEAAQRPLGREVWLRIQSMTDALAAVLDARGRTPRQGDGDDGIGLLLDDPEYSRSNSLLATGDVLFGARKWWPSFPRDDLRTVIWTALTEPPGSIGDRPTRLPSIFLHAGMVILRDRTGEADEIWCRCDHGPHGFLSMAAHAHADALSVEVRHGGIDVLADPGTYCYHGEKTWRSYFRSTIGHNTLELGGRNQSISGGPFMWVRHAKSSLISVSGLDEETVAEWTASHDGYQSLRPSATHWRTVRLDRETRTLFLEDRVEADSECSCRLAFHLGPAVRCCLQSNVARLSWKGDSHDFVAVMCLPDKLVWTSTCGNNSSPSGWYSPAFGIKIPSVTLIGTGTVHPNERFVTTLRFIRSENFEK